MPSLPNLQKSLLILLAASTSVLTSPLHIAPRAHASTSTVGSSSGHHGGFFYYLWNEMQNAGPVSYTNNPGGGYAVSWHNCQNFVAGKGWDSGDHVNRNVTYSADKFSPGSNTYLSVYGMGKDARGGMVEFYVVEDHGTYDPTNAFTISGRGDGGEIRVDGGRYRVGVTRSVLMQLPEGFRSNTITRVFSVRQGADKRRAGTVSMRAHVDVWKGKFGVDLGAAVLSYQLVAVEGYLSSGEAEVTISEA